MILSILLIAPLILKCLSKTVVLLPYNSVFCQNNSQSIYYYYDFTIIQQINLNTIAGASDALNILKNSENISKSHIDSENYIYCLCRTLVQPSGRSSDIHNEYGEYSFWNIRIKIDRVPGPNSCNDYLLLQFRHKENPIIALDGHSVTVMNITCKTTLPIIVPSDLRKLYITYFSFDGNSPGYVINVTSFIYFKGKFPSQYQQDLCRGQDGFWCVNTTGCIFRDLNCDGYDSCFDGGSDEADCSGAGNLTIQTFVDRRRRVSSGFIDYLPWLALGILPLILLLALICICNQHRSEVYFAEEDDNLEVDKSQDCDDRWSSGDDLDRVNDDTVEEVECCDMDEPGVVTMGLVSLNQSSMMAVLSSNNNNGGDDGDGDDGCDGHFSDTGDKDTTDRSRILSVPNNHCSHLTCVDSSVVKGHGGDSDGNIADNIPGEVSVIANSKILATNNGSLSLAF